jgi:hypothetical protein
MISRHPLEPILKLARTYLLCAWLFLYVKGIKMARELTDEEIDNNYNDEPWTTSNGSKAVYSKTKSGFNRLIINCSGGWNAKANAIRAAACVNACEGVPTEVLENHRKWMDSLCWTIEIMEAHMEDWDKSTQDRIQRISNLLAPMYEE